MYWGDLLTFEEIAEKTNHHWWHIKELFKAYKVPRMTLTERAKYKRETLYSLFKRLVEDEGISQRDIYKKFGYIPSIVRKTLQEGPNSLIQLIERQF